MSTCNRLDLQALGSQPVLPKNLPDHWSDRGWDVHPYSGIQATRQEDLSVAELPNRMLCRLRGEQSQNCVCTEDNSNNGCRITTCTVHVH